MRTAGFILTGGLVILLLVLIAAYGVLARTETAPFHLEVKEPPTANQQRGNIALPSVVESIDPEYLLTNIYTTADAPLPAFAYVDDANGDGNTVSTAGVFVGSAPGAVVIFGGAPTSIALNGVVVSGADAIPANREVTVVGGVITIPATNSDGGLIDGGFDTGTDDNTAEIIVGSLTVSNVGWTAFSNGPTTANASGLGQTTVGHSGEVIITGGTTTITGLSPGVRICRASVIVGRTIVDTTDPDHLAWSKFGGRATEARVSGLLGFTVPLPENAAVVASLNIDTGANSGGVIARDAMGNLDTVADTTADRLATLPLPRTNADLHDGAVSLPLQVGTRVELPAYAETPAVREIQLVIDLPDVSAIQCAAVTDARWEQPTIGTITTRNTYCGGVPLGGAIGQALVKKSDDDCGVGWETLHTVPGSGLDGQVLTWGSSGGVGAYGWAGP